MKYNTTVRLEDDKVMIEKFKLICEGLNPGKSEKFIESWAEKNGHIVLAGLITGYLYGKEEGSN